MLLDVLPWLRVLGNLIEKRVLSRILRCSSLWKVYFAIAEEGVSIDVLGRHNCCAALSVEVSRGVW